jgi:type 2A phosphatase activator TIP41
VCTKVNKTSFLYVFLFQMQASSHGYGCNTLHWEDTDERIDLVALSAKEPILFYDEVCKLNKWFCGWSMEKFELTGYIQVILYEDELADSGISFLTVRVVSVSQ